MSKLDEFNAVRRAEKVIDSRMQELQRELEELEEANSILEALSRQMMDDIKLKIPSE